MLEAKRHVTFSHEAAAHQVSSMDMMHDWPMKRRWRVLMQKPVVAAPEEYQSECRPLSRCGTWMRHPICSSRQVRTLIWSTQERGLVDFSMCFPFSDVLSYSIEPQKLRLSCFLC